MRILPIYKFRQGLRKTRHSIELKKGSAVIMIRAEGALPWCFTWDFPVLFLTLLCIYAFILNRMKLCFSKVTGMDISNSLRNTKLLGFFEGGLDGMG